MDFSITYLRHSEIDKAKWNACINRAENGLIYGFSFYLDAMAPGWDGLILNEYEAVFALPWRKKWNFYYLFQPFLTAQLGAFGNHLNQDVLNSFLKTIPAKFRYLDISLNWNNNFPNTLFPTIRRLNHTLCLKESYQVLYRSYKQNTKRNIKKAIALGCNTIQNVAIEDILSLARPPVSNKRDTEAFKTLYNKLYSTQQATTYGVIGPDQQMLASCVFFFSNKRAYYILVGNHLNGRKSGASHLLIDSFIQDHSGQQLTLDFEGSDIEGIASFYRGFGASTEVYPALRFNRLPWWCRWLKS